MSMKRRNFVLTEEGKQYAEEGLPEKVLLEKMKNKEMGMAEAKKLVPNFAIALQWAKKNSWVDIDNGKIVLKKSPKKMPAQEALERIEAGDDIDDKMINILLKRKLIEIVKEDVLKRAKKFIGKEITNLNEDLIKTGLWKDVKLKPYNVEVVGKKVYPGKRQPYNAFLSDVRQKLVEMGFIEMTGPIIELEFWNFDALFQPQNHPSRDWTETYSMKSPTHGDLPEKRIVDNIKSAHEDGWKTGSTGWGYKWDPEKAAKLMPRAHDTAISPRTLSSSNLEIPGKYFQMVRCYRPDVIDATHGVEFNQMGGFVVAPDLNFRNLLGLLKDFVYQISGIEKVKFYSDYYPFTEPSVQISGKHPELGWVELAGAGIFRPELTEPLGITDPVIAWGFGVDRLAMHKLNIKDIRQMFSRNLDWLRRQVI